MKFILWSGFGVVLAAALVHGAIGLRSPRAWKHLSFSCAMIFLCCYLFGQVEASAAHMPDELVGIERRQFCFSAGLLATLAWFLREYTGAKIPRAVVLAFYGAMALFVGHNLVSRHGGFLGSAPTLVTAETFGGEHVTIYSTSLGPMQMGWLAFVAIFLLGSLGMGVQLARRDRRRGIVLVVALGLMLLFPLADVVVGSRFPHFGALGVLSLAIIMTVDLAIDFRTKDAELVRAFADLKDRSQRISRMFEASMMLSDQLNTPLQTLELDLAIIGDISPDVATRLTRVRRNVDRLTDLGRRLQRSSIEAHGALQ